MDAFEFFFSFYGLILGLSVAEVITGLVRVFKQRQRIRIGWLTPMLGLFVLLDITSFWANAWGNMRSLEVSYRLLIFGLAIAGIYYAAASLVTPDDPEEWPDFDVFYDQHKRYVIGGVWIANLLAFEVIPAVVDPSGYIKAVAAPTVWASMAVSNAMLLALFVIKNRRINIGLLGFGLVMYGVTAVLY